jgi:hypothetical protein
MEPVGLEEAEANNSSATTSTKLNGSTNIRSDPQQTADITPLASSEATGPENTFLIMNDQVETTENGNHPQEQPPQQELASQEPEAWMNTAAASAVGPMMDEPLASTNDQETVPQELSHLSEDFDNSCSQVDPTPSDLLEQQPAAMQAEPLPEHVAAPGGADDPTKDDNAPTPLNYQEHERQDSLHLKNAPTFIGGGQAQAYPSDELLDQSAEEMQGSEFSGTASDPMEPISSDSNHQGSADEEPLLASGGAPDEFNDIFGSSDFANANMGEELLEIMSDGSGEQHQLAHEGGMPQSNGDMVNMDPIPAGVIGAAPPQQFAPPTGGAPDDDVIELLDDEDGSAAAVRSLSKKRKWPEDNGSLSAGAAARASAESRAQHMPSWMRDSRQFHLGQTSLAAPARSYPTYAQNMARLPQTTASSIVHQHSYAYESMHLPVDVPMKPGYLATWKKLLPRGFLAARKLKEQMATQRKAYALSVLNVSEFTIAGVSPDGYSDPSSVQGLRSRIRQFSRDYGKAVFERDSEAADGGKWRIPLGAYQAFYTFLTAMPRTVVQGIPEAHLNIAMLGRQRLEKGFPSVEKLIHMGVPKRMANTLAPFQRGGVDFVHERKGRALIADEMGKLTWWSDYLYGELDIKIEGGAHSLHRI